MATGRSERVKLFVENYYTHFQEGADTATIAKKYGSSIGHAYTLLDEIAAINGVDKEIFYKIEHGIHVFTDSDGRIIEKKFSMKEILEKLDEAETLLNSVEASLTSLEKEMLECLREMEENFR